MEITLLMNLGLLVFFSILGGVISTKFKQPLVLGLLIVGAIIGPNMFGIIHDQNLIDIFIQLGTILFVFVIGMEFSLEKIMKLGVKALFAGIFKIGIMFFIGFSVMTLFKFDVITATFVGVMVSFSSTTIIINILKQKNLINRQEVPIIMSVSIMEDIVAIIAITLFKSLKDSNTMNLVNSIENILIGLIVLVFVYILFSKFAEKIVIWIHNNSPDEMILFTSLLLCSMFAYLAYFLGLGASIGAFFAGSIISNFKELKSFHKAVQPYSYMFSAFFCISVGTMISFKTILSNLPLLLLMMVIIFFGLFLAMGVVTRVFANFSKESSIFSSIVMIPPALFSLLVAKESISYGVTTDLFSIISIIMLIFSFVLSYFASRTGVFANLLPDKKTSFKTTINNVSTYFETLFNEISLENKNSRTVNEIFSRFSLLSVVFVITSILIKESIEFVFHKSNFIFLSILILCLAILSYEIYNLIISFNKFYESVVKIIGLIDGGAKLKRIRVATINLFIAILLMAIGVYSPLILFIFKLPSSLVIFSLFIVIISLYFYKMASNSLHKIDYYESAYNYKRVKVKVNAPGKKLF
jgi:monovalent cation:H+ antiporter-2, CPA2 family